MINVERKNRRGQYDLMGQLALSLGQVTAAKIRHELEGYIPRDGQFKIRTEDGFKILSHEGEDLFRFSEVE